MKRSLAWLGVVAILVACGDPPSEEPAVAPVERDVVSGQAPPSVEGAPSVILFYPEAGDQRQPVDEAAVLDQVDMSFAPLVLVVPPGQLVEFRNSEDVAHNVQIRHLAADSVLFNEGPERGSPYHHTFDDVGAYDAICDIHPWMLALLLVDPAPYHAVADADGAFERAGVPPGRYTVRVWSRDDALSSEQEIEVTPGRTELALVKSSPSGG